MRKCEEMARRLRFFADQIHKAGLEAHRHPTPDESLLANLSNTSLDDLDNTLMSLEKETMEVIPSFQEYILFIFLKFGSKLFFFCLGGGGN